MGKTARLNGHHQANGHHPADGPPKHKFKLWDIVTVKDPDPDGMLDGQYKIVELYENEAGRQVADLADHAGTFEDGGGIRTRRLEFVRRGEPDTYDDLPDPDEEEPGGRTVDPDPDDEPKAATAPTPAPAAPAPPTPTPADTGAKDKLNKLTPFVRLPEGLYGAYGHEVGFLLAVLLDWEKVHADQANGGRFYLCHKALQRRCPTLTRTVLRRLFRAAAKAGALTLDEPRGKPPWITLHHAAILTAVDKAVTPAAAKPTTTAPKPAVDDATEATLREFWSAYSSRAEHYRLPERLPERLTPKLVKWLKDRMVVAVRQSARESRVEREKLPDGTIKGRTARCWGEWDTAADMRPLDDLSPAECSLLGMPPPY